MDYTDDLLTYMKQLFLDLIEDLRGSVMTGAREILELTLIETYFKVQSREEIMKDVVEKILPQKNRIQRRDVNYFSDNKDLFAGLPEDRIHYYGEVIMNSDRLTPEDRDVIWTYLDRMIEIAEDYKKNV
jgi:hypothetical protein